MTPQSVPDDLARRLLRWAADSGPGVDAAVALLVSSPWVHDRPFVDACVVIVDRDVALVDWAAVRTFVADRCDDVGDTEAIRTLRAACERARPVSGNLRRRRLAISATGASGGDQGQASATDDLLAGGFGYD